VEILLKSHLKYAIKGFIAGVLVLLSYEIYILFLTVLHYNGKCGGWMPFLSGPHDCSLFEYIAMNVSLTTVILLRYYWYWCLIILFLATMSGYALGRAKAHKMSRN
jgi:hypothetical protein